jgi:hypothetical protein
VRETVLYGMIGLLTAEMNDCSIISRMLTNEDLGDLNEWTVDVCYEHVSIHNGHERACSGSSMSKMMSSLARKLIGM